MKRKVVKIVERSSIQKRKIQDRIRFWNCMVRKYKDWVEDLL